MTIKETESESRMTAKLLIHPRDLYLTPKLKKQLRDGGYILVPEDQVGSIRVVEPLPDLSLDGSESLWLMQNLLELVLSDSFSSLPKKLGERMINRVRDKVGLPEIDKNRKSKTA